VSRSIHLRSKHGGGPGRGGVSWVEDSKAGLGTDHRQIFQAHLRRTILTHRHSHASARDLDVRLAASRHTDRVISWGKEAGEGRGKWNLAARREPHRHPHHVLLRDVALHGTVVRDAEEFFCKGGILHVTVESNDALICLTDCGQRLSKGLSG